jgi:hypothetical protein
MNTPKAIGHCKQTSNSHVTAYDTSGHFLCQIGGRLVGYTAQTVTVIIDSLGRTSTYSADGRFLFQK